jgi:hypothetical protein
MGDMLGLLAKSNILRLTDSVTTIDRVYLPDSFDFYSLDLPVSDCDASMKNCGKSGHEKSPGVVAEAFKS